MQRMVRSGRRMQRRSSGAVVALLDGLRRGAVRRTGRPAARLGRRRRRRPLGPVGRGRRRDRPSVPEPLAALHRPPRHPGAAHRCQVFPTLSPYISLVP